LETIGLNRESCSTPIRTEQSPEFRTLGKFAELNAFLNHLSPLTPYGRQRKQHLLLLTSRKRLEDDYRCIELAMDFEHQSAAAQRVAHHLKRIPFLDCLDQSEWDASEVFLIKRFLVNYRTIHDLLPGDLKKALKLHFGSASLLELLNAGGQNSESFFISDAYADGLKQVRDRIQTLEGQAADVRQARLDAIRTHCGLDFQHREFALIPKWEAERVDRNLVLLETYDASRLMAKPVFPGDYIRLMQEKATLVAEEKGLERGVLRDISRHIAQELDALADYVAAVTRLDDYLARARLSLAFEMTRPQLQDWGAPIWVQDGCFVPQVERCRELDLPYTPVNARFDRRITVVHGANMGGKTVLCKSLAFFQTLAQLGFFVPCGAFHTVVFEGIHCLGSTAHEPIGGLSSFGQEIYDFSRAQQDHNALYLMDEFARTTNSREAQALISAVLHHLDQRDDCYAFLATHYAGLPTLPHVAYQRMKGLDEIKYAAYHTSDKAHDISERVKHISQFMTYEVEDDPDQTTTYDALKIARILGLDETIIEKAMDRLGDVDG
jgi:DNA mismatch repair ATPase MutS